jgi:hypothetical protein
MEIPFSKIKMGLITLGSLAFVAAGIWLTFYLEYDSWMQPLIGVLSMAFFGLTGSIGINKLLDSRPGLIINEQGIHDNSSGLSAGFIPWEDIENIGEIRIQNQTFVQIIVKDPEKYLQRAKGWQKSAQKLNLRLYGSVINISANSLKINFLELKTLLKNQLLVYRERQNLRRNN